MKRFLKRTFGFIVLFMVLNSILFLFLSSGEWLAKDDNNRHNAFKSKASNRMFVIAGSSMGSSFDSDLASKKTDKEVYNVSFSVSHSASFVLNYIIDNVKKNDVVVYAPEYEHYYDIHDQISLDQVISIYINKDFFSYLDVSDQFRFVFNIPRTNIILLYRRFKMMISPEKFKVIPLTKRGDYIGRYTLNRTWKPSKVKRFDKYGFKHNLSQAFKNDLIETARKIKNKGGQLFISFPPMAASNYDARIENDLTSFFKESNLKLIGKPSDYVVNDTLILDHAYHTTVEGTIIRTETFINQFNKVNKSE